MFRENSEKETFPGNPVKRRRYAFLNNPRRNVECELYFQHGNEIAPLGPTMNRASLIRKHGEKKETLPNILFSFMKVILNIHFSNFYYMKV